jgi:hypothetical protein
MTLSQAVPALRLRLYHSREKMQEYAGARVRFIFLQSQQKICEGEMVE